MTVDFLFTGAQGQVGWELQRRAAAAGLAAKGFSRLELDITNGAQVADAIAAVKPRVVVNAAAYTAVDKAETDSAVAFAVNRDASGHLAQACDRYGIPLIHISTDYVFDGTKSAPYLETDPTAPLGVYGASKLAGEEAVRARTERHVILRTAWVYGIHGQNFVKTMLRLGGERDVLRVVDDQRGCPTFAGDLASAILAIVPRLAGADTASDRLGTFHCTGQGPTTWFGFAGKIFDLAAPKTGKAPKLEAITTAQYPTPARRPVNSVLDCGKLTRVYGITLRRWEDALREMLDATLGATAKI